MTEYSYPHSPEDVVDTLADLYRHQGDKAMLSLLESAEATIAFEEYDNWNSGQNYYSLQLRIPRKQFAVIESRVEPLQKALQVKLGTVFKGTDPHFLTSVVITPLIKSKGSSRQKSAAPDATERVWGKDGFRLFISHVSKHKKRVGELKDALAAYGVRGFVAHEDIQPTQDWQSEIETALNTMHGMVAIVTPEFKDSEWTDQEIGYALGRGIKLIAVKAGCLPHGLLARQQAMTGDIDKIPLMAKGIVTILVKDNATQSRMRDAMAEALVSSSCWADSKLIADQLETIGSITASNAESIRLALKENSQVSKAYGLPGRLQALLKPYPEKVSAASEDDSLPF